MQLRRSILSCLMAILIIGGSAFADDGDFMLFTADDGVHGRELWRTDGTVEGTVMVKDIVPGKEGIAKDFHFYFYKLDDSVLFELFTKEEPGQLWRSDGTPEGTVLVKKITVDNERCSIKRMFRIRDRIFIIAKSASKATLWRTDGTEEGTVYIKTLQQWDERFTYSQNALFYISYNPLSEETELWRETFSQEPAIRIKVLGWPYSALFCIKNTVYFIAEDSDGTAGLWKSDGTREGCVKVRDFKGAERSLGRFNHFFGYNGMLFFIAYDSEHGVELWKSDGTTSGTVMVKDIEPGKNGSYPNHITIMNGIIYFVPDNKNSNIIWRTDGTEKGTVKTVTLPVLYNPGINEMFSHKGKLYFTENFQNRFWMSDGTDQGTFQIWSRNHSTKADRERKYGVSDLFGALEDKIFYTCHDEESGCEMFSYDPAVGKLKLFKDINPGKGHSVPIFMNCSK